MQFPSTWPFVSPTSLSPSRAGAELNSAKSARMKADGPRLDTSAGTEEGRAGRVLHLCRKRVVSGPKNISRATPDPGEAASSERTTTASIHHWHRHARSASIACNCFKNRNDAAPERLLLLFFSTAFVDYIFTAATCSRPSPCPPCRGGPESICT